MKTICHFTSVHPRYDPRIFLKQCSSLAKHYKTFLIVADGHGDETKNGVSIIDVGAKHKNKLKRFLITTYKVYRAAKKTKASIYELHDPELLIYGLFLKKKSNKIIFDMHEDTSGQILVRDWIPRFLKKITAYCYSFIEKKILKKVNLIFVPQEFMRNKFLHINKTVVINNYPLNDFYPEIRSKKKVKNLLYVGSISFPRGIINMLNMLELINTTLTLVGTFSDENTEKVAMNHPAWSKVNYMGTLPYDEVKKVYMGNHIGLVPFCNLGQYRHSHVIKVFEYMAYGLPIIMPDFGDWKAFNEVYKVGRNTITEDAYEFSQTVTEMLNENIIFYSSNGRKHVKNEFLWDSVEKILLKEYKKIK